MEEFPVPMHVKRRLMTVLSHMTHDKHGGPCGLSASACKGTADIEDLAAAQVPPRRHSSDLYDDREELLFKPERFAGTQKPLLEANFLPSEVYSSRKWFEREMDKVFMPTWFLVGRDDEIGEPGSYIAVDTEWGGPVAVCRGKDGKLHAFANVCLHRGAKILPDGTGKASKVGLVCPYHAWTYEYTGALKWAPGMQATQNFDEDSMHLVPVRLAEFHGFVFICCSNEAGSLEEALGDLPEKLPWWFGPDGKAKDMVCVSRREYEVECNWKFLMENTCETYHTSTVHRSSLGPMKSWPMDPHRGDWDAVCVTTKRSVVPLPTDFEGETYPLPAFCDQTRFTNLFPSLQINVTWDCLWWMHLIPLGPTTTKIIQGHCFPREVLTLERFPEVLKAYQIRWHVAVDEDNQISLNQQRGVRSNNRRPGRFGQLEFAVHNFNNWLLSRMLDASAAGRWDPGRRIFVGDQIYSNDDDKIVMLSKEVTRVKEALTGAKAKALQPVRTSSGLPANGARVCVTGASGFIGLHVVDVLLARGYHVVAAVRDASDERKVAPLLRMQQGAQPGSLELVGGCDLLSPGSFDKAVANCEVCFHVASPFWLDDRIADPFKELILPAERGTLNVLNSCAKASTMRRVVVTSSLAAVMNAGGHTPWASDFHYNEQHWNVTSSPVDGTFPEPQTVHAYRWSKTTAEKTAWAFVEKQKPAFDVTCILPPMVLGSNLQNIMSVADLNQSSLLLFNLLSGKMSHVQPGSVGFADVRDVAKAHVLAAETSAAGGQRYLCSSTTATWLQVANVLRELFPGKPVPVTCADGSTTQPCMAVDNSKIRKELGMEFAPLVRTLQEQGDALIKAGLLQ